MRLFTSAALAATIGLAPALAFAQATQDGLVNVNVSNTTVQVPIALAAQVCPNVDVDLLTTEFDGSDEIACTISQKAAAENGIAADSPGADQGSGRQQGLVNINVDDTEVQVPIGIAAQVCPDLDADIIAQTIAAGDEIDCTITQDVAAENGIEP